MKALKNKIRSHSGASISFALLIFLVCAVVSSVVIVAGTAAAGRMSRMAESDRRYYAVTSASELLCGEFSGKTVNVVYDKKAKAVKPAASASLLTDASEQLAAAQYKSGDAEIMSRTFALETDIAVENTRLDCTIVETLRRDGLLVFDVSNADDDGVYSLRVTFASNLKRSASDTSKDTESTTVSWKLHSIKKLNALETAAAEGGTQP